MTERHPVDGDYNPRRRTRCDELLHAVIALIGLIVLGVIGMVVLHP